ncbi:RsmE family RNA methyltransferase [Adlercreutzia agrestimuris]|uniref:RsmE family RNA methyltransferase n=1 Tax=Adlercreutzia agrestimuris TaxID=2941324 RepID=UPI00203C46E9|nr:16S rRNA (uracil(1498)-N(3))-methyltransferase [Adlercreutzia agrestimuris]
MSLPHFYLTKQIISAEQCEEFVLRLDEDDLKHARVLRLSPKEHIAVVDAQNDYFECEIVSFDAGYPTVRIAQHLDECIDEPVVVLVQGLAKGDKMESIIRHATEVGVSAFIPFACERAIVKLDGKKAQAKQKRWEAIAKSAAMQSGRRYIPEIAQPLGIHEVSELIKNAHAVLICWEEAPGTAKLARALNDALIANKTSAQDARVVVVVGPEGGLTQAEVDELLAANKYASLVTLGPTILRTETAGVVAPALVLHELRR